VVVREGLREGFGSFPVVGYVWYQDDWGAPRFSTSYSFHAGNDLFAVKGTPVIAVVDGSVYNLGSFSKGGNAVWLMGDDGVEYYYGHLQAYRRDLKVGTRLERGELLGWVGDTGNAKGTYPHVHFEVDPGRRGVVNPKPLLDAWLDAAEEAAVGRLDGIRLQDRLAPLGAARWDSLFDVLGEAATPAAALWTSGLDGSTTLAQLDLALAQPLGPAALADPGSLDAHPCTGTIRPGAPLIINDAFLCTLNWVYEDEAGALSIGTAGDCLFSPTLTRLGGPGEAM
jgi:hypothetical protein